MIFNKWNNKNNKVETGYPGGTPTKNTGKRYRVGKQKTRGRMKYYDVLRDPSRTQKGLDADLSR